MPVGEKQAVEEGHVAMRFLESQLVGIIAVYPGAPI